MMSLRTATAKELLLLPYYRNRNFMTADTKFQIVAMVVEKMVSEMTEMLVKNWLVTEILVGGGGGGGGE